MPSFPSKRWLFSAAVLALCGAVALAQDACLTDSSLFGGVTEETCCQNDVCGIPCPEPVSDPGVGTYR